MEVQRLVFELAVMPESVGLLESIGGLSAAAQQTSALAADLPDLLAKERAATIEQLTGILDSRQGQLQSLIVELRSTLEAGTTTSDSVQRNDCVPGCADSAIRPPRIVRRHASVPATLRHHPVHGVAAPAQ